MTRYIIALLACLALAHAAWSQDVAEEDTDTAETEETAEPEASDIDDSDLLEYFSEDPHTILAGMWQYDSTKRKRQYLYKVNLLLVSHWFSDVVNKSLYNYLIKAK